jgi:hypothetical protein
VRVLCARLQTLVLGDVDEDSRIRNCSLLTIVHFLFLHSCVRVLRARLQSLVLGDVDEDSKIINYSLLTIVHFCVRVLRARMQTFVVGDVDEDSKKLVKTSHDCLAKAIAMCKPGVRYRDVGDVITRHAQANGWVYHKTFITRHALVHQKFAWVNHKAFFTGHLITRYAWVNHKAFKHEASNHKAFIHKAFIHKVCMG